MESLIINHIDTWITWGYPLAFFTMLVEGDFFIFIFGFLTQIGLYDPLVMYLTLYAGAIVGDVMWYMVGSKFKHLPRFINAWVEKISPPFDDHLRNRTLRTLFFSKFTYGFHRAFFVRAGMLKLPLKRFVKIDLIASVPWILIVGGLGYISGASYVLIKHYVKFIEVTLLGAVVIFVVIQHYLAKLSKRKL